MGYEIKLDIDGVEYLKPDIEYCNIENSLMASTYEIGNVMSCRLSASIRPKSTNISRRASVNLWLKDEEDTVWKEKGKYFIAIRKTLPNDTRLEIECYDIVRAFEETFRAEWPRSMQYIVDAICYKYNIKLDPRTIINPSYQMKYGNNRSARELLQDIASAHAGNFCVTDSGKLRLVPVWAPGTVYEVGLKTENIIDKNSPVNTEVVTFFWKGEDWFYTAGSGVNEMAVTNPVATQEMVNDVYAKLIKYTYQPYEATRVRLYSMPSLIDITFTVAGDISSVVITFNRPVEGLSQNDITITNITGSATISDFSGAVDTYTLALENVTVGTVAITIKDFDTFRITSPPQVATIGGVYESTAPVF